ncbi:unnamed protein product [Ambrosiozyma monospora]|uniref:Unnamed protein product n=1 Tax=Ambrosiozyma monospora TaxID=43982 RepID=A0ACB5TJH9_AMBMO|nr:unnamed protein product [Ambrosiozyma monospora]
MTIPEQANFKFALVLNDLRILDEVTNNLYYTINYDESDINWVFPNPYYAHSEDLFFNINIVSKSARLEIFNRINCLLCNGKRLFNRPTFFNDNFFHKFSNSNNYTDNRWLKYYDELTDEDQTDKVKPFYYGDQKLLYCNPDVY